MVHFCVIIALVTSAVPGVMTNLKTPQESLIERASADAYAMKKRMERSSAYVGPAVLAGLRAAKILLVGASPISKKGAVTMYEKQGGYEKAVIDFSSIGLESEKTFGGRKWGLIGDRVVSIDGTVSRNPVKLIIQKPVGDKSGKPTMDIIIYKN